MQRNMIFMQNRLFTIKKWKLEAKTSILSKNIPPVKQVIGVVVLLLVFNIIAYFIKLAGIDIGKMNAWEISLTCLLFFALGNALFFLNSKDKAKYWRESVFSYIGLVAVTVLLAGWISGIQLNDSGSIKWIYFVFTFGYLVFISIIGMMRRIVELVIKQDKRLRGEE